MITSDEIEKYLKAKSMITTEETVISTMYGVNSKEITVTVGDMWSIRYLTIQELDYTRWAEDPRTANPYYSTHCYHDWQRYTGFVHIYDYCTKCGEKKDVKLYE